MTIGEDIRACLPLPRLFSVPELHHTNTSSPEGIITAILFLATILNYSIPSTQVHTKFTDMADDGVVRVIRNPQAQQASREEPDRNDDCWDFENMGSHLQVTHIDGTVRNVDRDALGTTISSESGRVLLVMLVSKSDPQSCRSPNLTDAIQAQSLAITAAFLSWVAPGNTRYVL